MADTQGIETVALPASDTSSLTGSKELHDGIPAEIEHPQADGPSAKQSARAILTCVGAFFALFTTVGFLNAWGIFQEYYHRHQLSQKSESAISWIGSFAGFAVFMGAAPAGLLADRVGPMPLLASGSLGLALGIMMTSLCTQYYQFFLAQALLMGVSMSFLTIPAMTTVSHHFNKHRGLATGFTIAGSSAGGIVWPVMLDRLLNADGVAFGWTVCIAGFVMLAPLTLATLLVHLPLKPEDSLENKTDESQTEKKVLASPKNKKTLDLSIAKNPTFILYCAGVATCNLAMFTPFFFLTSYAASIGISTSLSFYLLSILNGASLFGRIIVGTLADTFGPFNLTSLVAILSAVIAFCWTRASSVSGLVVWATAYGFSSGAILSLQLQCATALSTPATYGTAMGLGMGVSAVTNLIGPPISAALIPHGYLALSMWAGSALMVGALLLAGARLRMSRKLLVKV